MSQNLGHQNSEPRTSEQIQSATRYPRYADASLISSKFAETIEEIIEAASEITIVARREGLLDLMTWLRDEAAMGFDYLSDVSGVDLGEFASPRFAIAYHLYSFTHNHRLRVKVFLEEDDARLPTMWELWKSSNWLEREVYDMFGVTFDGHPNLVRILTPADYEGHPLRKDFPIKGY
ncbi:MAG: NADH-quinone oxidoreductase subunit C [Chloracidobacterium sp.]|nr:NADH-quinone oxidoreductase subunit C [Chloracidobacterium sp.]